MKSKLLGLKLSEDRKFQVAMVVANLLILLAAIGMVAFQLAISMDHLAEQGVQEGLPSYAPYYRFLSMEAGIFYQRLLIALFGTIAISVSVTLYLTYKLTRPIIALKKHLHELSSTGQWQDLKEDKNEFFHELSPAANKAFKKLKTKQNSSSAA